MGGGLGSRGDGSVAPALAEAALAPLLASLDPFARFEVRSAADPQLLPAVELLLAADDGADHDLPLRASCQAALARLVETADLPQADPGPIERVAQAVADLVRGLLLAADRAERVRLVGLLRAVLLEASRVRPRAVRGAA